MVFKRENKIFEVKYRFDEDNSLFNANVDIFVRLKSNKNTYISTFYTFENILYLKQKFKETGECLNGTYFWGTDMFLINDLKPDTIDRVLHEIIDNGEFDLIFIKTEPDNW